MTRLGVAAATAVISLAGCGGGRDDDAPREDPATAKAARYLDPRSDVVAALSLDLQRPDWRAIQALYTKAIAQDEVREELDGLPTPPTVEELLALLTGAGDAEALRKASGGRLLLGARTRPGTGDDGPRVDVTLVYTAPKGGLRPLVGTLLGDGAPLEGLRATGYGDGVALVGGDTLVASLPDEGGAPDAALRERLVAGNREDAKGPDVPTDPSALLAVAAKPAALGLVLGADQLPRALTATVAGKALRGAFARVDVDPDGIKASGRVDFAGLRAVELPVGDATPLELPAGVGIGSASADQQRTTTFLTRLARELLPDSRFVRRVEALERAEDLRFEDEVLRAFAGPSLSVVRPDPEGGEARFLARSALRDPARMRALLPRIAPRLPGILEGLQGLRSTGLLALLLVAPDAPLTPAASDLLASVEVRPLDPDAGPDEPLLFALSGLDPRGDREGPDALVYGIVDDEFVVGSSRALALEAATLRTVPGAKAGTQTRVDLAALAREDAGLDTAIGVAGRLFGDLTAQASAKEGDVVITARAATK